MGAAAWQAALVTGRLCNGLTERGDPCGAWANLSGLCPSHAGRTPRSKTDSFEVHAERLYLRGRPWGGQCYRVAGRLVTDRDYDRTPLLVHGAPVLRSTGVRYSHAWVEVGGSVFDLTVNAGSFDRAAYYSLGRIVLTDCVRYTAEEARALMLETGQWGPWHDDVAALRRPIDPDPEPRHVRRKRAALSTPDEVRPRRERA